MIPLSTLLMHLVYAACHRLVHYMIHDPMLHFPVVQAYGRLLPSVTVHFEPPLSQDAPLTQYSKQLATAAGRPLFYHPPYPH